jgi:small subunit ribosomal protein S4
MRTGPKHKLCRRLGSCVWGSPKCPSVKRPFAAGPHGGKRRSKLSTYGELLMEKQKLKAFYGLTERSLRFVYLRAKKAVGATGDKLLQDIEMRLCSVVWRSGLAPTVFAARQAVTHRHILIDGKIVDRPSFRVKAGQVISVNSQKSPAIASISKSTDIVPPPYLEIDREACRVTVAREPLVEEIHCNVQIMRVVEYYAR